MRRAVTSSAAPTGNHQQEDLVRKTTSGLLSLALATGLGATLTVPIAAATATPSKTPTIVR